MTPQPAKPIDPSIKIELYHEYSSLDRCHQFGIVTENLNGSLFIENYIRWIWFHVGKAVQLKNVRIYPYAVGKLLYSYKFCNDAERQGKMIAKRINSFSLTNQMKKHFKKTIYA